MSSELLKHNMIFWKHRIFGGYTSDQLSVLTSLINITCWIVLKLKHKGINLWVCPHFKKVCASLMYFKAIFSILHNSIFFFFGCCLIGCLVLWWRMPWVEPIQLSSIFVHGGLGSIAYVIKLHDRLWGKIVSVVFSHSHVLFLLLPGPRSPADCPWLQHTEASWGLWPQTKQHIAELVQSAGGHWQTGLHPDCGRGTSRYGEASIQNLHLVVDIYCITFNFQ